MLIWSVFTEVEEIAKAKGQVVPLGHRQIIQSQMGGTIDHVYVEEGDVVKKGDLLMSFIAVDSQSVKEELESKEANLTMKIERYNAFKEQRLANFTEYDLTFRSLVIQHQQALSGMNKEVEAIKALSNSEREKTQAEFDAIDKEIPALQDQIKASRETVEMMDKLIKTGGVSQVQRLETIQKLDSYTRELTVLNGKKNVLAKTLTNQQDQFEQKKATILKEIAEKVSDTRTELLGVKARLKSSDSQIDQTTIEAPVNGIIQSIPSSSVGSVINPGDTVTIIVPTTATALLEARLSPRDIGFVEIGQSAKIKVDAFDYSRYGALDGIVKKISPSTDSDERGGVFYKVQISIEKPYFGESPGKFDLIPGMTGEADIVTGDKTVFQYLWKPVFTNVSNAFGER